MTFFRRGLGLVDLRIHAAHRLTHRDGVHNQVVAAPDQHVLQPWATPLVLLLAHADVHSFATSEQVSSPYLPLPYALQYAESTLLYAHAHVNSYQSAFVQVQKVRDEQEDIPCLLQVPCDAGVLGIFVGVPLLLFSLRVD